MSTPAKPIPEMRVAVVCNWNDKCGISTYSKFLVNAVLPKVKELVVFSENTIDRTAEDESFVRRCWKRGESLKSLAKELVEWKPDYIIIQHEYGIFANAMHWLKFMQDIDEIPYLIVMHSVYEHLDKAVYASVCKNILVHSQQGKQALLDRGSTSNLFVLPHGCITLEDTSEIFNILRTEYSILQFGFGFRYKGVERMLEAVSILKHNDPKFKDIFYTFMLSTNGHNSRVHAEYYDSLVKRTQELDIVDNVAIIQKYSSDEMLNLYLRTYKLAVFPYVMSPENTVYGASGATRIAMANGIPVICSESHLFDDLDGVVPRPNSAEALAREIDEIFSNGNYKKSLLAKNREYIASHSWDKISDQYLGIYNKLLV